MCLNQTSLGSTFTFLIDRFWFLQVKLAKISYIGFYLYRNVVQLVQVVFIFRVQIVQLVQVVFIFRVQIVQLVQVLFIFRVQIGFTVFTIPPIFTVFGYQICMQVLFPYIKKIVIKIYGKNGKSILFGRCKTLEIET